MENTVCLHRAPSNPPSPGPHPAPQRCQSGWGGGLFLPAGLGKGQRLRPGQFSGASWGLNTWQSSTLPTLPEDNPAGTQRPVGLAWGLACLSAWSKASHMNRSWLKRAQSSGSSVSAGVGSHVGGGASSSSWGLEAREAQGGGATPATDRASQWDPTPGKSISPASWPWDRPGPGTGWRVWWALKGGELGPRSLMKPRARQLSAPPAVCVYPSPPCIISFGGLGSCPPHPPSSAAPSPALPSPQLHLPRPQFPPGCVWIRLSGPSRQTRAAHKPPRRKECNSGTNLFTELGEMIQQAQDLFVQIWAPWERHWGTLSEETPLLRSCWGDKHLGWRGWKCAASLKWGLDKQPGGQEETELALCRVGRPREQPEQADGWLGVGRQLSLNSSGGHYRLDGWLFNGEIGTPELHTKILQVNEFHWSRKTVDI